MPSIRIEKSVPIVGAYDVVVCGGGPAGFIAAVTAAREGAKTALIERFGFLGGMATAGYVAPISEFKFDDVLVIGPTTGTIECKVEDMRVEMKPAEVAEKGVYCSVAIPVGDQPEDRINDHPAKEASERIHPRRGDRVYLWADSGPGTN